MGVKFEITAKTGEYTDSSGQQKARYTRCGVVLESRDGKLSAKLESLPVNFDGWLNFWEPREKDAAPPASKPQTKRPVNDIDEEIPF